MANLKFAGWRAFIVIFSAAIIMVVVVTIMDKRFDLWYLLVPGMMLIIGLIQVFYRRKG
jgi:hypothetical protein